MTAPNLKYFTGFDVSGAAFLINEDFAIISITESGTGLGFSGDVYPSPGSSIKDIDLLEGAPFREKLSQFLDASVDTDEPVQTVFAASSSLCRIELYPFYGRYIIFAEIFRPRSALLLKNASDIANKLINGSLSAIYDGSMNLMRINDFESKRLDIKQHMQTADFKRLLSFLNFDSGERIDLDSLPVQRLIAESDASDNVYSLNILSIDIPENDKIYFFSITEVSMLRYMAQYLHTGEAALSAQKILNIAAIETSVTGSIISCSGSIEKYSPELDDEKISGAFIGDILEEINIHEFNSIKREIKETGIYQNIIKRSAGGASRYFSIKAAVKDEDRNSSLTFIISDITDKMEEERKFRVSESNYRSIVESSGHLICKLDLLGTVIFHSMSVPEYLGRDEDEVLGRSFFEFVDPVYALAKDFNLSFIRENYGAKLELPLKKKNGNIVYVYGGISPIYDLHREITGYSCVFSDISFLKLTENILNMKIAVFETAPEGLALECDRRIILANKSLIHLFGYEDASEIIGSDSLDLVDERDIKKVSSFILRRKREAKLNYEFLGKKKNGEIFTASAASSNYEIDGKVYTASVIHEVSDRKIAAGNEAPGEDSYADLISNMHDFLWRVETVPGKQYSAALFTPSVINITGYTAEDFVKDKRLGFRLIHPDDLKEFKRKIRLFLNDRLRRSGDIEFRIINKSGKTIWIRTRILLKRDPQGKIISIYGQTGDISAAKRIEEDLKKSKDDLARVNETKDRFISIISHDLRTPFSSILGFTEFLLTEKDIPEDQKNKYIGYIHEAGTNILSLVNSLLDWTRLQTGQIRFYPEKLNAKNLADKSAGIVMGAALQKKITIDNLLDETYIYGDENLLMQTFNNLLSNAVKFTHPGGKIKIYSETSASENKAVFVVEDDGVGILEKNLPLLFRIDSKFTLEGTKGEKGSGIGLSLCKDIVAKHGGEIWVESQYGRGSKFKFSVPFAAVSVLLADDSLMDRLLYAKILKNFIPEYSIVQASNGKDALDIILSSAPALVISDHLMPEMGGVELVKRIKSSGMPNTPPVIILSADINKSVIEEYSGLGVEYIFQKPVDLSVFKKALEKSLQKQPLFNLHV